jgi:xanthine/CO dehydrogenase XdhC/CoxF family maturation factor
MTIERSIIDAAARLRRNGESHLVATVVRVSGTAYRRPGARMLLTQFRWLTGAASGGCLEGDIASNGWARTRDGQPVVVTYDSRMPEPLANEDVRSAFGLGCDGVVEVLLERGNTPGRIDPLAIADECVRTQKRGAVVTVIHSRVPGVKVGQRACVIAESEPQYDAFDEVMRVAMIADAKAAIASGESDIRTYNTQRGSVDVFIEAILPPPRVFVFGCGHDAVPLVAIVKTLGWDVSIVAGPARVSTQQRFHQADEILVGSPEDISARIDECDRAVAVVMSHSIQTDQQNLAMLLGTKVRYIGVLGPRLRTAKLLADIGAAPDRRVHSGIGVELLGADTPQEIALAIASEIQAVLARTSLAAVRERVTSRMPRITEAVLAATVAS